MSGSPRTLSELLETRAGVDEGALCFPELQAALPMADLASRAARIAGGLRARGVGSDDVVGVVMSTRPAAVAAFFGVLRAGAAVAPLPVPLRFADTGARAARLRPLLDAAGIRTVVAPDPGVARFRPELPGTAVLPVDELDAADEAPPALSTEPGRRALVQCTSGSTAAPKAVVLTHANVLAGIAAIRRGIACSAADTSMQWLPLCHDMGLVGMLTGIAAGTTQHLWRPEAFIGDPTGWIAEFARLRATIYTGPTFSFAHLLQHVDAAAVRALDLRAWRVALNGAEPIDPDVLERFVARFGPAGFRPEAMFPVYGMAEATLAVAFPRLGAAPRIVWVHRDLLGTARRVVHVLRGDPHAKGLVSVGAPVAGMAIRIVGEDGTELTEGFVGEIEIAGDAVTSGYLGVPRSPGVFRGAWLRTGDLGFRLDGDLFVTGRLKQMIVVNGINYYPEDAEAAVVRAGLARAGRCAAVALAEDGPERMVVVIERPIAGEAYPYVKQVERTVRAALGIDRIAVLLVPRGTIRRTTSGKLERLELRHRLCAGELRPAAVSPPAYAGGAGG